MRIIGLGITIIMSLWAAGICRKSGAAGTMGSRGPVMGTGFFTAAFYLDAIFFRIMEHAAGGSAALPPGGTGNRLLQGIGLLVSKGILAAALLAFAAAREEEKNLPDTSGPEEKGGWEYLDGLTVGVSLLFLLLAVLGEAVCARLQERETPGPGRNAWQEEGVGAVLLQTLLLAVLLSYYVSLYLHRRKQRLRRQRAEEDARRREADIYLESVENHYQRTRELWHDLRNHISLLNLLLQEKKFDQMADYLRIFGEDAESLALPVKSGNTIVDALLADKTARAKRDGVTVELSLCDLSDLRLRPDEICGLLGNLLDNALEANRRAESGRFLAVECENREEYCYIRIRNATGSGPVNHKKDLRNQVGHGIGLRSAQRIAHGCGGELIVEQREGCFTAVVRLPSDLCRRNKDKR